MLIGLLIKFLAILAAVAVSITSPFLLTLLTTQASKATGNKSILSSKLIFGINFLNLSNEAIERYLSFSSLTTGLIFKLEKIVLKLNFCFC